jgi:hypothetical protein
MIRIKFRESKVLLRLSRIKLKYLEVLEKYETWPEYSLLDRVQ